VSKVSDVVAVYKINNHICKLYKQQKIGMAKALLTYISITNISQLSLIIYNNKTGASHYIPTIYFQKHNTQEQSSPTFPTLSFQVQFVNTWF
jgi:hypothetical protein